MNKIKSSNKRCGHVLVSVILFSGETNILRQKFMQSSHAAANELPRGFVIVDGNEWTMIS